MESRRLIGAIGMLLAAALAACAGGSGSSGFDVSPSFEDAVIDETLAERNCATAGALTICPADQALDYVPGHAAPEAGAQVDTSLSESLDLACPPTTVDGQCSLVFSFAPMGFPEETAYRVAVRDAALSGLWLVGGEPTRFGLTPNLHFEATVEAPRSATAIQLAVLVFLVAEDAVTDGAVDTLAATGADFAFVSPAAELVVQ